MTMSGHIEETLREHEDEHERRGARGRHEARIGRTRGPTHLRLAGLWLTAVLVLGMALAGSVSAAPVWLVCLEGSGLTKYSSNQCTKAESGGKWQSLGLPSGKSDTVRLLVFSLRLEDTGLGASVECPDVATGWGLIESPNKGLIKVAEVKEPEKEGCKVLKGFLTCKAGNLTGVKGLNLPWKTEVFETEKKNLTKILSGGGGEPGWAVTCGGVTDECVTESGGSESVELVNEVTKSVLLVSARFEAKGKSKCSVGGKETGKTHGSIAILLWSGNGLSVNPGSGGGGEEEATSTTLTTSLSGEGHEGEEITVLEGSKAKDKATLSGTNASKAGGTIKYKIYSDKECKTLVTEAGEVTVTSGSIPASTEEELEGGKTYYWQASYSGDAKNKSSTSSCGSEILNVKAKTTLSTTLSGEGQEGEEITVLEGAKVKDDAKLSGTNSSSAGGKVIYKVYSDSKCEHLVTEAGEETVSSGTVPASEEKELEGGKTYYWQATYKGDSLHQESTSTCGEISTITTTSWSLQEPPAPTGARASYLFGVSCASSTECTAVGSFRNSSETGMPLAEQWNGTTWSPQEPSTPTGTEVSALKDVSCTSSTKCIAVGYFVTSSAITMPLAEQWNGTTWSSQEPPAPTGNKESYLNGVSCTSSTECIAVGSFVNSSNTEVPLAEKWNGTSWSSQEPPTPTGAKSSPLDGVSCTSSTECTAVGLFLNGSDTFVPLAEKWNGTTWSSQEPPTPTGATYSNLGGVSCTSSTECTAVGIFKNSSGTNVPLAEKWNGTTWSLQEPPTPTGAKESLLGDVSCTSSTACIAVGAFVNSSGKEVPLAEEWNGTTWSLQGLPAPTGAKESHLNGVSCTSSTECTAIGLFLNSSGTNVPLAERMP
ncbi:MAG: hypothetical protein ACRDLF_08715 [Solirubrobacteraceae bacterium]